MEKEKKTIVTELNESDRKVLDKYARSYTNFIESNTAKNDALEDLRFKDKE